MSHGRWKWLLRALVLTASLALLAACGSSGGGGGEPAPVTPGPTVGKVTVSGQVSGSGALPGVAVSAGGVSATTDANGFYSLAEVPVPDSGRLVLTFKKTGYGTYQRSLPVEAGKTYAAAAQLAPYNVSELANVDPTVGQTLQGVDPTSSEVKVKLEMPAGSLSGATGNVTVNMVHGDPSTTDGRATFPGDYMAAPAAGSDPTTELESVAFAEVSITAADGTELTEFSQPATLTLRLPDEFQTGGAKAGTYVAGDAVKGWIEWWSYDETTGAWLEEDADADPANGVTKAAVIDDAGVLYAQGKVSHFSWWNADHPVGEHACLCATVEDAAGPLSGVEVVAEGVSYNGTSYPALTGADGKACVNVKRSADGATETVRVTAKAGSVDFPYGVTSATEGDVSTDAVTVWSTQGSTRDNTGRCYDLENTIRVVFDGRITGTVTYENSGQPAGNFTLFSNFGPTAVTDELGGYSIAVPLNVPVLLFAPGLQSQSATVTDAAVPAVLDFVLPNRIPTIDSLVRSPDTTPVDPGSAVSFLASATDPDGDPLTYSWTADTGSPTSGTGASFAWRAPAEATTATVTVTVQDDKGASASQGLPVVVGGGVGGTTLKFTVRDNSTSNLPVAGVYVIRHGADGSVAETMTTGADGIADFGDIGQSRTTVTVAYESGTGNTAHRDISTFVQVLAGDVVYYLDEDEDDTGTCATPSATVDVTTSGYPATADFAQLQPMWTNQAFLSDSWTGVDVCPSVVQTDGKVSLLASAFQYDQTTFAQNLLKYGFLLDQTLTNGGAYPVSFDRDPLLVGWSASGPVSELSIDARRKGVDYGLAQFYQEPGMGTGTGSSGNLFLPTAFPADAFRVAAMQFSGGADGFTSRRSSKKYQTLPTTLVVPLPDYDFTSFAMDATTNVLSWTRTGTSPADAVLLSYNQWTSQNGSTYWEAAMAPTANGWTPVTLPEPVASWIDETQTPSISVSAIDFDIVAGFDATWSYVIQGNAVEQDANVLLEGSRSLNGQEAFRAAGKAADGASPQPASTGQPRGFRRLMRR